MFNFSSAEEIESNAYSKYWRDNKEYYGIFKKGVILLNINDFLKASELITFKVNWFTQYGEMTALLLILHSHMVFIH